MELVDEKSWMGTHWKESMMQRWDDLMTYHSSENMRMQPMDQTRCMALYWLAGQKYSVSHWIGLKRWVRWLERTIWVA